MAAGIARQQNHHLSGTMVEWTDLVQEAMIAAMQAVDAYHPIDDGKTFTSFVHVWVKGIVSKKVNETTRTVSVPRTILDKFVYVKKAIDLLGLDISHLRGGTFQDGKWREGRLDDYTLTQITDLAEYLSTGREFTEEEVQELVLTTQDELSMDIEMEEDEETVLFGETVPDDALSVEEQYDGHLVGQRLMDIIRQYTTDEEYTLMELRYGMGAMRGYMAVAEQYVNGTGKPMNKGKVAQIEEQVLDRMRRAVADDPELLNQLKDILATVQFMPKR